MSTKEIPADGSSRWLKGLNSKKTKRWFDGAAILWKPESEWYTKVSVGVDDSDLEVKAALMLILATIEYDLAAGTKLEATFTSRLKVIKTVAIILQLK